MRILALALSIPSACSLQLDRRTFGSSLAQRGVGVGVLGGLPSVSRAEVIKTEGSRVLVAGATGQTGSRVLNQLIASYPGLDVVAGVRTPSKLSTPAVKLDVTDQTTFTAALDGTNLGERKSSLVS